MENKKEVIWTACTVLVLALAGGGFWLWHHHKPAVAAAASSQSADSSNSSTSNGGLSVSNGSATNLGQLNTSSQNGESVQSGTSSAGSSGSSSSASSVDPSTFAQYDKYKSNSSALFGDIQVGGGATLGSNQKAVISYKGWLTDGTLFDQSQTNSSGQLEPLSFTLGAGQVVPGMEQGVAGMKVGGTRLIIIPPALGYGAQGQGSIPPNAVLVFEVNLLDVQ